MGKAVNLMLSGKRKEVKNTESGSSSNGQGGIPNSLKVKAAGTKNTPIVEKTVNKF